LEYLNIDDISGIGAVRSAPLVRVISNTVLFNESLPNYSNTLLVMTFGQFLDHDMINTPTFRLGIFFIIIIKRNFLKICFLHSEFCHSVL